MTNSIKIIQTLVIGGVEIRSTGLGKEKKVGKGKNKLTYVKFVEQPTKFACKGANTKYTFIKDDKELNVKKNKKGYKIC